MAQKIQATSHNIDIARFLEKIVIDVGVGRLSSQPGFEDKILAQITDDVSALCGQKPQVRRAKKSIAGFKIREGSIVGLRVTLRRKKMVDFFEKLIKIVMPRVRDFTGLKQSAVDGGGVLNVGIKEQYVFPEIVPDKSTLSFSLGINIVPRKKSRKEALEKYMELGVPLKK
ncbi:MAG: 50S ribosomal protein L5 [bacterium]|nr:50S ribosomal protein L5 [bacterium]